MKASSIRNFRKEPMNTLEAEIAVTALYASEEFTVIRKLNLERESRFTLW
jgi:hypothetical protein